MKYLVGDKIEIAKPGARIQVAKGVVHGFTNVGTSDARHILISTPRHQDDIFRAIQRIPQPHAQHMDELQELGARSGLEIVGPLP
jgi:uncharacterized cupin superfamily protein